MHINFPTIYLIYILHHIQATHWHTIFAAFNEQYDAREGYTIHYFLDKDLGKFSDIISKVHCLASQQSRLREKVGSGISQTPHTGICTCTAVCADTRVAMILCVSVSVSVHGEEVGGKDH